MNHFIKLPDGTVINVGTVRMFRFGTNNLRVREDGEPERSVLVYFKGVEKSTTIFDPDDIVRDYFESIAQEL
jgi:hypothetical protein